MIFNRNIIEDEIYVDGQHTIMESSIFIALHMWFVVDIELRTYGDLS